MISYEINESEYNILKYKKQDFKTNHEIVEGDRLYILNTCKINKYYLDEYLENNYDNVTTIKDINNANVIIANSNNFNYNVDIGYQFREYLFRNEDQWKVFISRNTLKPGYVFEENVPLLSDAYKNNDVEDWVKYEDAKPVHYIEVFNDELTIPMFIEYNESKLKVIDENLLIEKITSTIDNSEYELTDVETLLYLLQSKRNEDISAAITSINKLHRETIVTKIFPYYFSESLKLEVKVRLYNEVFKLNRLLKNDVLSPDKARFSTNYINCIENMRRIQTKYNLEIDKNILLKSFMYG
jgi:hypothetical protein